MSAVFWFLLAAFSAYLVGEYARRRIDAIGIIGGAAWLGILVVAHLRG